MKAVLVLALVAACSALTPPPFTGTTPPVVPCPDSLCEGKDDGNFDYRYYGRYRRNYFLQCSNGLASCQPCFPLSLEFSERCNQCLYNRKDDCVSTDPFLPAVTFQCPDLCPQYGPRYSGNVADPHNNKHYVGCWKGQTVGCVACPSGLLYNQQWNACLYEGLYKTQRGAPSTTTTTTKY